MPFYLAGRLLLLVSLPATHRRTFSFAGANRYLHKYLNSLRSVCHIIRVINIMIIFLSRLGFYACCQSLTDVDYFCNPFFFKKRIFLLICGKSEHILTFLLIYIEVRYERKDFW